MKRTINGIAQKIEGTGRYFCQSSKKMAQQINNYIDEQIDERYENMKTGKPREDRRTREKLRFFSGIVFIGCIALLVAVPIGGIVSAAKDQIIELTIKSPDELLSNLSNDYTENYPEIQVISDDYTNTEEYEVGEIENGEISD